MSWRIELEARLGALHVDVALAGDGRPLALIGPNGGGKTTLLRVIAGALPARGGHIEVDGALLYSASAGVDVPIERRAIGYVPQGHGLFAHLDVLDNVAFAYAVGEARMPRAARRARATAILDGFGLRHLATRWPAQLSGGERQRVALARALAGSPRLLLLDEPLAALDATSRRSVRAQLAAHLAASGRPAIVVTHDVRDVLALGATVCVLEAGRIVQRGEVEALRAAPESEFVAEFVAALAS